MKSIFNAVVLFVFIGTTLLFSQPVPNFQHVIIVVQENRTPDNLFSACAIPGADLVQPAGEAHQLKGKLLIDHGHKTFLSESLGTYPAGASTYVMASDIQAYCQLAMQYGFGDRMFQTNQGPSFPAHQILFRGTVSVTEDQNGDFVVADFSPGHRGTCANPRARALRMNANTGQRTGLVWPCFDVPTMADQIETAGLSWKYYSPRTDDFWTAPNSIMKICNTDGQTCAGPEWQHVISPHTQILADIQAGALANVSWVVPAGGASDHPALNNGKGPSWIASIVNAIGTSPYWQDTVILVTWDDWGGFWDHVPPPENNSGWCSKYCYGFRVPLLVISARTPANYVSHAPMDFNSLLAFVADNFQLPRLPYPVLGEFDSGFFVSPLETFHRIEAPKLTAQDLIDVSDPDDD